MVYRSPYATRDLDTVISLARSGDGIVLMQDAVLAVKLALEGSSISVAVAKGVKLYGIDADLKARSVKAVPPVESITYDDLVELLCKHNGTYS